MLSSDRVIELIRTGNPVPDCGDLPEPRVSAIELLHRGREEPGMPATERSDRSGTHPDLAATGRPSPRPDGRWRGPAVAVAAMALILATAGLVITLTRLDGDDAATEPQPPTTISSVVDEATARRSGLPYDPAVHDLCAWFEPAEVGEIVAAAYDAVGATPRPTPFVAGEHPAFPHVACSWSSSGVFLDASGWDGRGYHTVMLSVDGGVTTGNPQVNSLSGGELLIYEEEQQGYRRQRTDSGFAPSTELSDQVALIGAVVYDEYAWTPPGPPAAEQGGTVRLRVAGHSDIYLTTSVISDPPVAFSSGPVPYRIVDVGLAVAQDLLERMHWIDE